MATGRRHRVVITGMGMSASLGAGLATCWRRLLAGDNGIVPLSFWDPAEFTVKVAAEARHIPRDASEPQSLPARFQRRGVRLFVPVVGEALSAAGLDRAPLGPPEIGLAAGASVNYLDMRLLKEYFRLREPDRPALDLERVVRQDAQPENSFHRRLGDMFAAVPAKTFRLGGPALVMDTACAASAHAVGEAFRLVRRGRVRAMVAGGSAALVSPFCVLGFALLNALSRSADPEEASRPFDRRRDGFVLGEGAGAVVLESEASARARGARIFAELAGFGSTLNAYNLTDPSPDSSCEARAMELALADAGMRPEEVDYVAAHGTSTPKNDATETAALKQVFGAHARRLLVSSNKGQLGHTVSAAGIINLICAVKAMEEGQVPPTMHLRCPDPECDLDYAANQSRRASVRGALANAFAFGGQNAALAVRAWEWRN